MKFESQLLKGIAPVVVLEILSRGPMYGYELSQAVERRSAEVLTLGKGTLYPLLYNLEAKKLIEGKWETSDAGRKRRYYSLTGKGEQQLARQKTELIELTKGLDAVLGGALKLALESRDIFQRRFDHGERRSLAVAVGLAGLCDRVHWSSDQEDALSAPRPRGGGRGADRALRGRPAGV